MKIILAVTTFFLYTNCLSAHGVGEVYKLPIPLEYYLYSSALAVFLSFFLSFFLDYFPNIFSKKILIPRRRTVIFLRVSSIFLLLLTILTGLFGTENVSKNFSVLFFWVFFLVSMNMVTIFFGNIWSVINPWKFLVDKILTLTPGRFSTPRYLPILLIFGLFWFELISNFSFKPLSLSVALLLYTFLNILGYKMFKDWFLMGELFENIFNFISKISYYKVESSKPNDYSDYYYNYPYFSFIFVSVLLAGVSFDSIKETIFWFSILDFFGYDIESKLVNTVGFLLTIIPFAVSFLFSICLVKKVSQIKSNFSTLIFAYLPTLSPIVLGYYLAHNFSIFIVSIPLFIPTIFDPFGFNYDFFGLNSLRFTPIILSAKVIWYIQILFIILGHAAAVIYTHIVSKTLFENKNTILYVELLLLPLMIAYTVVTLWFISLPLVG